MAAESSSATESLATTAATTAAAPAKANFVTVTDDYFSDALFIGDSRTDGIRMFSGLNNTTYFCSAGLDFKDAFKKTLSIDKTTKSTLENLLATKKFGKIYIMLGINELGFPMNVIESHATQVIPNCSKIPTKGQLSLSKRISMSPNLAVPVTRMSITRESTNSMRY